MQPPTPQFYAVLRAVRRAVRKEREQQRHRSRRAQPGRFDAWLLLLACERAALAHQRCYVQSLLN